MQQTAQVYLAYQLAIIVLLMESALINYGCVSSTYPA